MRDYLRRTLDEIWVIDCSPEGHQPDVNTRIFQGVQQPVCIVLVSRTTDNDGDIPAHGPLTGAARRARDGEVRGARADSPSTSDAWVDCPTDWREPRSCRRRRAPGRRTRRSTTSSSTTAPASCRAAPGSSRPMRNRLVQRWQALISATGEEKEALFHPHLRDGEPATSTSTKVVAKGLPGHEPRTTPVAEDKGDVRHAGALRLPLVRPAVDHSRQPAHQSAEPGHVGVHSDQQVYLTALVRSLADDRAGSHVQRLCSRTCTTTTARWVAASSRSGRDAEASDPNVRPTPRPPRADLGDRR